MADKKRFRVAHKSYTGKNLFVISSWIEEELIGTHRAYSDVVFFEFTELYEAKSKSVLALSSSDMRSMVYGVRELLKTGKTQYEKYTDPNLAGTSGNKKKITFGKTEGAINYFFINFTSGAMKIGFSFDTYGFAGFADSLSLIAEETEKALYYYQRSR